MKTTVSITDFRNNIGTYIDHIVYKGDSILITKGNKIVAKVVTYNNPTQTSKTSPLLQLAGLWSDEDARIIEDAQKKIQTISKNDVKKSTFSYDSY